MEIAQPTVWMKVNRRYYQDKVEIDSDVFEGEPNMEQNQVDALKAFMGDGQAKVTVSRELSEVSFGCGGKVFVSVTLSCDQSLPGIQTACDWAKHMAENRANAYFEDMRPQLEARGLLKPREQ